MCCSLIRYVQYYFERFHDVINLSTQRKLSRDEDGNRQAGMIQRLGWVIAFV